MSWCPRFVSFQERVNEGSTCSSSCSSAGCLTLAKCPEGNMNLPLVFSFPFWVANPVHRSQSRSPLLIIFKKRKKSVHPLLSTVCHRSPTYTFVLVTQYPSKSTCSSYFEINIYLHLRLTNKLKKCNEALLIVDNLDLPSDMFFWLQDVPPYYLVPRKGQCYIMTLNSLQQNIMCWNITKLSKIVLRNP